MADKVVNLEKYRSGNSRVFSGRPRGEAARRDANLNEVDKRGETVLVIVPDNVRSVNSSFFLGMFEDSIIALGKEEFERRYELRGPAIQRAAAYGIAAALNTLSPLGV